MKMSPEFVRAQANMMPGVITSDGFLGEDNRPIVDIIADDEAHMERIHLDFDQAAEKMHHLLDEGRKGLGEPITVANWIVQVFEARGHLASPFEDGIYRKVNAQVTLASEGTPGSHALLYSDLSLHLMEKYHFLQGKGSPFRLEPDLMKKVLFPA
jgi:hypothetical protein